MGQSWGSESFLGLLPAPRGWGRPQEGPSRTGAVGSVWAWTPRPHDSGAGASGLGPEPSAWHTRKAGYWLRPTGFRCPCPERTSDPMSSRGGRARRAAQRTPSGRSRGAPSPAGHCPRLQGEAFLLRGVTP